MNPLLLAVVCLAVAVAGWAAAILTSRYGMATPVLPATALVTMGVIVTLTLVLGIRVLRWRNSTKKDNGTKKRTPLNPILAARTLVLAQACAYAGSVLLGWHAGIFVDQLRIWSLRSTLDITWVAFGMAAGGLVMVVVGLVVERFCKIPPEDGETDSAQGLPGQAHRGKAKGEGEYAYRGD